MDIQKTFELWAGPMVRYVSHRKAERQLWVSYSVAGAEEPAPVLEISCHLRNGLNSTVHLAIKRLANSAQNDAYLRSGQYDRDIKCLQSGKLT